jgi:PAS domain S-box-containing protein
MAALMAGCHYGIFEWPAMVAGWGGLSALAIGLGLYAIRGLGVPEPAAAHQGHEGSRPPDIEQVLPNSLGDRQALFNVFMDHLPALAFIKDSRGRYLYINSACREMLNMTPEEMIGRSDCDLWPEDTAKALCLNDALIITGNQVYTAREAVMVGEEQRHYLVTKFGICNAHQPPLLGGIAFDMTEKVRAEEEKASLEQQLIQSQKMEAIGTLAGGIAHDFNNVLGAIMGYVELALFDAHPGSNVQEELEQVLKATHRATELVRQILTFSRKTGQERQTLDPKSLVGEVLKLIRATLPTTIEIRQHLETDGAQLDANATQLHQVVMNLCTNAAHAMEESGGILEVRLERQRLSGTTAGLCGVSPGRYLEIRISDTGHGIAPALKQRIFDPYFTTKAQGKGTGMGLAVVRSIVQSHGGAIDVESEPGKGSCFKVLLPLSAAEIECSHTLRRSLPRGTESVLFIDDEPVLVEMGTEMLRRLGYDVTGCEESLAALSLFNEDPYRFDLVVSDTTMPGMTGDTLLVRMLAIRPDLPSILCTGYSEQMTPEKISGLGISDLLMKPLSIGDLARTVRRALDAHAVHSPARRLKVVHE